MIPLIIPASVVILTGVVCFKKRKLTPALSTEQSRIYNSAINGALKDPVKLRRLSDVFAGEGHLTEAKLLRQRAALRELPPTIKIQRQNVFRRAMNSKNKTGVLHVADAYDREGCTGAAKRLRDYASGLP